MRRKPCIGYCEAIIRCTRTEELGTGKVQQGVCLQLCFLIRQL